MTVCEIDMVKDQVNEFFSSPAKVFPLNCNTRFQPCRGLILGLKTWAIDFLSVRKIDAC